MAFKPLMPNKNYIKYSECNPKQVLVKNGSYLGHRQGTYGIVHEFLEMDTKDITCLNSAGQLNYQLDKVVEGTLCQVIYEGKQTLEKGKMKGKEAHNFTVLIDEESEALSSPRVIKVTKEVSYDDSGSVPIRHVVETREDVTSDYGDDADDLE